ncbi:hypothetical protein GGS20DRAFT_306867 [Poronia punctata]|nr:hypothetical protein GGS20DRAFT_306867 [Poronia punctata]
MSTSNEETRAPGPQVGLTSLGLQEFPANVKPPISTNSVVNFDADTVKRDALSTRIVVHPRFPALVQRFLDHKRLHGSSIEKALYTDHWTWEQQAARMIEKRALVFMTSYDYTFLRTGDAIGSAANEWDRVGTEEETKNTHLFLRDYLSYDEIMLSSLIAVSGQSFFINDGSRYNAGGAGAVGSFEPRGVIVGLVGTRFERPDRMDSVYVLKDVSRPRQHPELREIFYDFFGKRKSLVDGDSLDFDINVYKARIRISADILLLEANARAREANKKAYVYIVGLGLGVWQYGVIDQSTLYVQAFLESLEELSTTLTHIGILEFAYVDRKRNERTQLAFGPSQRTFEVRFSTRNPAQKLSSTDSNHLLVLSYAWDGNAFPGNEYWGGELSASGDPAAACMSTIGELHNPLINPGFLGRIKVLGTEMS